MKFAFDLVNGSQFFLCHVKKTKHNGVKCFMKEYTGIPRFTLLMWGHTQKMWKQKPRKSRLLSSTKGEGNRIEL